MTENRTLINVPKLDFEVKPEDFERVDIFKLNRTDQVVGKPSKYIVDIFKRFVQNKWAVFFFVIFLLIILMSIFAPLGSKYSAYAPILNDPLANNLPARLIGMFPHVTRYDATAIDVEFYEKYNMFISKEQIAGTPLFKVVYSPYKHSLLKDFYPILGTDGRGVDIWSKLWTAMGISLGLAFSVAICTIIIGVIYGSIAGSFAGKWPDTLMMRFVEIISGVPSLVWLLILGTVLSVGNKDSGSAVSFNNTTVTLALIFILWFSPAISTRTYILKNKDVEYVQATRTLGGSQTRIIFLHMIPVILGRIAVIFVNLIPTVIFYESSLVFLNLKPTSDLGLGVMLNEAWTASNISLIVSPIFVFASLTISAQIVANALNDAIDPRVVGRK